MMPAARPVRRATTVKGVKPWVMANFPKTGAIPKKIAELTAANIPAVLFFDKIACLFPLVDTQHLAGFRYRWFTDLKK
jgi:hypothetical protein